MPKNIVILFDGTSNQISENRTNILRLYGALEKSARQLVFYDPGVGTLAANQAWLSFWPKTVELWGMATGWGLDDNVKDAYRFLVENYARGRNGRGERDAIFIFGFSRGAYTARVLAGFINAVGLVEPRNSNLIDYAYRAYKRIDDTGKAADTNASFAEVRLYERLLNTDRPPIRLLGLFDTVASVIESGRFGPRFRYNAFTKTNPSVESVRHAVAIDEHRTMFEPQLWPVGGTYMGNPFNQSAARPQDVREVWFPGCHGDVGGGHPDRESALAKVPLEWMIEQTAACGVHYRTQSVNTLVKGKGGKYVPPDPLAASHPTMKSLWPIAELVPRRQVEGSARPAFMGITVPFFERRHIPDGAHIHWSVQARKARYGLPMNLPDHYVEEGEPPSRQS